MSTYGSGLRAENAAADYLRAQGMAVLEQRYRARGGEIDLIAREGDWVVFVEVKYRAGQLGSGLAAVDAAKRRRITRAAAAYLALRGMADAPARFDVLEITPAGILHVKNAFMACM